jgi:hypothetical protein
MRRTTVRLNDQLLRDAKKAAAESGQSLTRLIEDALRETLTRRSSRGRRHRVHLPTYGREGVLPGVDLDNSAALLDLMEGIDSSR